MNGQKNKKENPETLLLKKEFQKKILKQRKLNSMTEFEKWIYDNEDKIEMLKTQMNHSDRGE
ncbi:MAG: hypothetical protein UIT85_07295 [Treponema sp.]|nr:hypothetical protein [Treponema sp.]MEE0893816.1 hypothetical protein [Treponema sp.]